MTTIKYGQKNITKRKSYTYSIWYVLPEVNLNALTIIHEHTSLMKRKYYNYT